MQNSQPQTSLESSLNADSTALTADTNRLYVWSPRSEVAFIQAIFDAYEGVGRIRTERHENDRSLLLVLTSPSQKDFALDLLRQIEKEITGQINFV